MQFQRPAYISETDTSRDMNKRKRLLSFQPLEPRTLMAGNLDVHFGVGGVRTEQYTYGVSTEELTSEAITDKQGRVVVAATTLNGHGSSAMLARFHADGSYDTTFGNAGKTVSPMYTHTDRVVDVDLQSNGKIIVLCQVRGNDPNGTASFSLMRFLPNGELDTTFGDSGRIRHQYAPPSHVGATAMAVGKRDEVYVLFDNYTDTQSIIKCRPDGNLDSTFANNGKLEMTTSFAWSGAISVRSDESLIVATGYVSTPNEAGIKVQRILPTGEIDTAFGNGNVDMHPDANMFILNNSLRLAIDSKDELYVGSTQALFSDEYSFVVTKLDTHGLRKPEFGVGGTQAFASSRNQKAMTDLDVLPNGELAVSGVETISTSSDTISTFVRLRSDGSVRSDLGNNGIQQYDFLMDSDVIKSAVVNDGTVLSFIQDTSSSRNVYLRRYMPSGERDPLTFNPIDASSEWSSAQGKSAVEVSGGKIAVTYVTSPPDRNYANPFGQSVVLSRFLSDGSLDSTFGFSGKIFWNTDHHLRVAESWLTKNGSDLYFIIQQDSDISITKLKSDGAFDSSFGNGGWITWSRPGAELTAINSIVPIDDGFLISMTSQGDHGQDYLIAKLNLSGALVTAFGTGGIIRIPTLGNIYGSSCNLAVQSTGKIIAYMANTAASGRFSSILKQFDAFGQPDVTFGQNGIAAVGNVGVLGYAPLQIALLSDDRIVVLSTLSKPLGEPTHFIARFNANGTADLGFGPNLNGKFDVPSFGMRIIPAALAVDSQNRAIVTLSTLDTYQMDSMIIRVSNKGELDGRFGRGGTVETILSPLDDQISQISVTANGDILGTGFRQTSDQTQAVFLRLLGTDSAWQNPSEIFDVDDNKSIDPLDVLNLINYINSNGSGALPSTRPSNSPYGYLDVDGDLQVSPLDVLQVINLINAARNGEGEATKERSQRQEGHSCDFLNYSLDSIELSEIQQSKKRPNSLFHDSEKSR